jgi:predicted NBD/HSP70 family sugar kinase
LGWQEIDANALFRDELKGNVELSNDANAAAISERIGGIGQNLSHFAYLYFGAGLGLGLISQNQIVSGAFGNAGEIGHIPITTPEGAVPLETKLSRVSVRKFLTNYPTLDFQTLENLFHTSDLMLMDWLSEASHALAQAAGMIENFFDPQTIILGGAMPEVILDHLISNTKLPSLSVSNRPESQLPRLQRGKCGRMTATKGAASLILNSNFSPQTAAL